MLSDSTLQPQAMLVALWLGAGLVTLAAITAICNILAHVTLVVLAYRVCPGLKLRHSSIDWKTIKELYVYSGKSLVPTLSDMLMNQTASVMVIGTLGPASLAVFTRPKSLLRQLDSLERKMAMILVPTTSSMDASGQRQEIQSLMTKSVRYSVYLVLPLMAVLVAFGGDIMHLWMGPNYPNWALPAILAVGFLGNAIQTPVFSMLSGLNLHGRAGVGQFAASAVSAVGIFAALNILHWGLEGAALAVTLPLLVVNLLYLPAVLCRRLDQDLGKFYRDVAVRPVLLVLPFAACLGIGRLLFATHSMFAALACAVGGAILSFSYWNHVLPHRLKSSVLSVRNRILNFAETWAEVVSSRMAHRNRHMSYAGKFLFVGIALLAVVAFSRRKWR